MIGVRMAENLSGLILDLNIGIVNRTLRDLKGYLETCLCLTIIRNNLIGRLEIRAKIRQLLVSTLTLGSRSTFSGGYPECKGSSLSIQRGTLVL